MGTKEALKSIQAKLDASMETKPEPSPDQPKIHSFCTPKKQKQ